MPQVPRLWALGIAQAPARLHSERRERPLTPLLPSACNWVTNPRGRGGAVNCNGRMLISLSRLLSAGILLSVFATLTGKPAMAIPPSKQTVELKQKYASLPISFEENRGQADSRIKFLARASSFSIAFQASEAEFFFAHRPAG